MRSQLFRRRLSRAAGDPDHRASPLLVNLSRQRLQSGNRIVDQQQPVAQGLQLFVRRNAVAARDCRDRSPLKRLRDEAMRIGESSVETSALVVRLGQREKKLARPDRARIDREINYFFVKQ